MNVEDKLIKSKKDGADAESKEFQRQLEEL